ncbi:MAG: ribbon-helix-helix protein, CopG family [Nitrospinota bacterium]
MPRKRRILRLSIPSGIAEEFEALARKLGKTEAELLREMLNVYKAKQGEDELYRLQRRISRQLNRPNPLSEKEIGRIVYENR